jgi:hypothetical protein
MPHKTLIIGVGGTGLSTIREIRRLIAERYELGLEASEVSSIRFLYIDTDAKDIDRRNWSVLGKKIDLHVSECAFITGDKLGELVRTPENYPAIDAWLPPVRDFIGQPGDGAKGIRPYGRLIYEAAENKALVRKACVDLYNGLDTAFPQFDEWRIYLIAGLSGGTGSGMSLPLSVDLVKWNLHEHGVKTKKFASFFVLPPLQISERHERYHQNAYAFLRELNYRALQAEHLPYTDCYLVEPRNAKGRTIGLDSLPLLIAHRIFLNFQAGQAATTVDALMDNKPLHPHILDGGDTKRQHATCFSTFGLSSVSYPRETVAQCLAYQQAAALVKGWITARDHPKNVHQGVMADLHTMRLSLEHVWGDADPFANNNFPSHEVEVNNLVDQGLQSLGKKQLGKGADKVRQNIEESFRQLGYQGFYKQRDNDIHGAIKQMRQQVRYRITALLRSPEHGLQYSLEFLRELTKILTAWKQDAATKSASSTIQRQQSLRTNFSDSVNETRNSEQKLMYTDKAYERDRANVGDNLKTYLRLVISGAAAKYAAQFLDLALVEVQSLEADLARWQMRMTEVNDALRAKLQNILDSSAQGTRENGKVIFNTQSLDALIAGTAPAVILPAVEEALRHKLGQERLDLLGIGGDDAASTAGILYEAAYQWVLGPACPVDLRTVSLYTKFVEAYPREEQRQDILKQAEALSSPFLRFSPEQLNIGGVQPTTVPVTVIPSDPGKMVGNQTAQSLVQKDLQAVQRQQAQQGDDPERIVFLQECQIFPLRYIELLKELKKMYDDYQPHIALHIDKRESPELYELYALTAEDRRQMAEEQRQVDTAEEVFLLARVLQWLVGVVNPKSEVEEIRYEFKEPGLPGTTSILLGESWEEAFRWFVTDGEAAGTEDPKARKARSRLSEQARLYRLGLAGDAQARRDLAARFETYLAVSADAFEAGIRDPRYERDVAIIRRVLPGPAETSKGSA